MIDYGLSYQSEWRLYRVDTRTWADGPAMDGLMSASVTNSLDGDLMQSADIGYETDMDDDFEEGYYRIVMAAFQGGEAERVEVATLHCASTTWTAEMGMRSWKVTGRSVLYPASERRLLVGQYAPAGCDGVEWAVSMLRSSCLAPVGSVGSFTLDVNVVFDTGTSYLEAVWKVLDAGGYTIDIDGRGRITVMPMPSEVSLSLDSTNADLIEDGASGGVDLTKVHNRYYAIEGTTIEEAINDDPDSIVSTVRRGYCSDVVDRSPKRVNGETLAAYARRKLAEDSVVVEPRTYRRDWANGVRPGRIVMGSLRSVGIEGMMRVKTQKVTVGDGIMVEETAEREVSLWR